MAEKTTFIATGDAFMTRRLPEGGYPGFAEIQEIIGRHDVRFNNLEITIHNQEGYPAVVSGGTWAMAEPEILDDLKKFGFNLYNTANNHSGDYSCGGVLATCKYLRERDMIFAGTGATLREAAAPAYLETKNARVALIASSVCENTASAIAGDQSVDMIGRPGLNPLRFKTTYHVEQKYFDVLKEVVEKTDMNASTLYSIACGYANPLPEGELAMGGLGFKLDTKTEQHTAPLKKDLDRMIANIQEARRQADYVLVSIHSHKFAGLDTVNPAEFMQTYCKACLDAGADAILGHGPHELQGIEIYKGKPIFYSLGNFIFQTETVSLQPADAYQNKGMAHDTFVGDYMNNRSKNGTRGYCVLENIWRSVMAGFTAEDGKITQIQLYPIDMRMGAPRSKMGIPHIAENDAVLQYLAKLSEPFGTKLTIKDNVATIDL